MTRFRNLALQRLSGGVLALSCAASIVSAQARAAEIGSVAAANEDVVGTPPAAARRQLRPGLDVQLNERIETSDVGAGQFLFLDQTSLTVWPNSDVVLDEYVYDPNAGAGDMALSMTKGVLRFIGGRISKTQEVTITTQHAVVAVRGGIAQISVTEAGTRATHIAGEFTRIGGLTLSRTGATGFLAEGETEAVFEGVGGAEEIAALFSLQPGEGDGGAEQPVTEDIVGDLIRASIAPLGSLDPAAPTAAVLSTLGETEPEDEDEVVALLSGSVDDERVETLVEESQGEGALTNPVTGQPLIEIPEGVIFADAPADPFAPFDAFGPVTIQPLPTFSGGRVAIPDGFTFVDPVTGREIDAAEANIFAVGGVTPAVADLQRTFGGGNPTLVTALGANGQPLALVQSETGQATANPGGGVTFSAAAALGQQSPFFLASRPGSLLLDFFGSPTPVSFWTFQNDDTVQATLYDVSEELFTNLDLPLPGSEGALAEVEPLQDTLFLIPQTNAPVVSDSDGDAGFSKLLSGFVAISGEGAAQSSAAGTYTASIGTGSALQPQAQGVLDGTAQQAGAVASTVLAPYGFYPGSDGSSTYGDQGEFFVLANQLPFGVDGEGGLEATPARITRSVSGSGLVTELYGDTRLAAAIGRTGQLGSDNRFAAASAGVEFAGQTVATTRGFDAGFAAGAGATISETTGAVTERYTLSSVGTVGEGVQVGFNLPRTSALAALSLTLNTDSSEGGETALFNFGDTGAGDAFLTENVFAARGASGVGALNGQVSSVDGQTGDAANGFAQPFRGYLMSSGLAGDGGVFSTAVDTAPQGVVWGWWGGEFDFGASSTERERYHLNSFLAGVRSDMATFTPSVTEVSYTGFALAHAIETGAGGAQASYVDGGRFRMTYDFGSDTGEIEITEILGLTLTGAVAPGGLSGTFQGALTGATTAFAAGAFFADPSDPIVAVGGEFGFSATVGGAAVEGSGIFGADRDAVFTAIGQQPAPPPATGLDGFVGAEYVAAGTAGFVNDFGEAFGSAGVTGLLAISSGPGQSVVSVTQDTQNGQLRTLLNREDGGSSVFFGSDPVLFTESVFNVDDGTGASVRGGDFVTFQSPNVFYLRAFDGDDAGPTNGQINLVFAGLGTPADVWTTPTSPVTNTALVYTLSNDLFTGDVLPVPSAGQVGAPSASGFAAFNNSLILAPQSGGPTVPAAGAVAGPQNSADQNSRWLYGYLVVNGDLESQRSALGVLSGTAFGTQASQPALGATVEQSVQTGSDFSTASRARTPLGTLDDGAGQTAYGANGEFFVLSNAGAFLNDDTIELDPDAGGFQGSAFGTTRLASLSSQTPIPDAVDFILAETQASALSLLGVDSAYDAAFDAGYAAINGYSAFEADIPYQLTTRAADRVTVGFDTTRRAVAVSFRDLTDQLDAEFTDGVEELNLVDSLTLGFGGTGANEGVYLNDRVFGAQHTRGTQEPVFTTDAIALNDNGVVTQGDRWRGHLASSGLVGDGGVFPNTVDATPTGVRWGWWGGRFRNDSGTNDQVLHLGTFVTGVRTDVASFAPTNSAVTYGGFTVANVRIEDVHAGGIDDSFIVGGRFTMAYDFAAEAGSLQLVLGDFDPEVLSATVVAGVANDFEGRFVSETTGADAFGGEVRGAFFDLAGGQAVSAGGNYNGFFVDSDDGDARVNVVGTFGGDITGSFADGDALGMRTTLDGVTGVLFEMPVGAAATDGQNDGEGVVANGAAQNILVSIPNVTRLTQAQNVAGGIENIGGVSVLGGTVGDDGEFLRRVGVPLIDDNGEGTDIAVTDAIGSVQGFGLAASDTGTDPNGFGTLSAFARALRSVDDAGVTQALQLAIYGTPTPTSYFQQTRTENTSVDIYTLSPEVFTEAGVFFPADRFAADRARPAFETFDDDVLDTLFAEDGTFNGELVLLRQTNGPLLEPVDQGSGAAPGTQQVNQSESRWGLTYLWINGEGTSQDTALGVMTDRVLPNLGDRPTLNAELFQVASIGEVGVVIANTPYGLLADTANVNTYGTNANDFGLGNINQFGRDQDAVQEAQPGEVLDFTGTNTLGRYGDTRIAVLEDSVAVLNAGRIAIGADFDTVFDSPFATLEAALDTGYAAGVAVSVLSPGAQLGAVTDASVVEAYNVVTAQPGVRVAFQIDEAGNTQNLYREGLAVEFSDLNDTRSIDGDPATSGVGGFQLNFGNVGRQDILIDDTTFSARESRELNGQGFLTTQAVANLNVESNDRNQTVTGLATSVGDPTTTSQTAFTGGLASSGMTGDVGVFPAGTPTTPTFLRWGWWNGEVAYEDDSTIARSEDVFPLGSFVAGVQADIANVLNATGTATYDGFAIAHVTTAAGGRQVDGGRFRMTYDLGAPGSPGSGTVQLENVPGGDLAIGVTGLTAGDVHYSGAITGTGLADGVLRGSFVRNSASDIVNASTTTAGTVGSFNYGVVDSGQTDTVTGVFGADRITLSQP